MEGPRPPLDQEFPQVVQFLDRELRPAKDWSITNEYPVAFDNSNLGNIRIITDAERVLSHAVMRPIIIKSPAGLFKVAAIGSVVTSPEARSQGYSKQILESCLNAARDHGCEFAILWTDLYDFYRKLGFELAGSEVSLKINHDLKLALPEGSRFLESSRISPEAIHRVYSQHTVTSLRTVEETRKYLSIPNSHVYTLWDAKGTLRAYAVEGKGADLTGYIHEWGGGVSYLLPLLSTIRARYNKPITIIAPAHASNLIRKLKEAGAQPTNGFLGMIKILNPTQLFGKIKRRARGMGLDDLVMEKQGDKFYIGSRENVFMTDSEVDLVRLVFGPQKPQDLHSFDPVTLKILQTCLPLPLWIWGWDSI